MKFHEINLRTVQQSTYKKTLTLHLHYFLSEKNP